MEFLEQLRVTLAGVHPMLPAVALILGVWFPQWMLRRYFPTVWEATATFPAKVFNLEITETVRAFLKVWQALPSIMIGAAMGALSGPEGDITEAVRGALAGALAPIWHELLKVIPGPYQGGMHPATTRQSGKAKEIVLGLALAVFALGGLPACGAVAQIVPILAKANTVITQTAQILDIAESMAERFFTLVPDPAKEKLVALALEKTRLALASAGHAIAGAKKLDEGQVNQALADFRQAYTELHALLESTGVLKEGRFGAVAAGEPPAMLPEPLALEKFEE